MRTQSLSNLSEPLTTTTTTITPQPSPPPPTPPQPSPPPPPPTDHPNPTASTITTVSRSGRQLQRYNQGQRQVVGCIPYRLAKCDQM
ncbi:putative hydrolase [Helianthus annuus]|uniref:Hydrolase n=1 Tax=Helianthus annuus TaxID=4232 RepID=A0A251UK72_HELAN|nr:putative hydrolase [Helianthus annuus]